MKKCFNLGRKLYLPFIVTICFSACDGKKSHEEKIIKQAVKHQKQAISQLMK